MIKNDLYRIPFPARGTWFEFYIRFTLGKYENGTSTERRENLQRKNNFILFRRHWKAIFTLWAQ